MTAEPLYVTDPDLSDLDNACLHLAAAEIALDDVHRLLGVVDPLEVADDQRQGSVLRGEHDGQLADCFLHHVGGEGAADEDLRGGVVGEAPAGHVRFRDAVHRLVQVVHDRIVGAFR